MTADRPTAVVAECARCGEPMTITPEMVEELDPTQVSLVHAVCPRDRKERRFAVKIVVTELVDDEDAEDEPVGGFTVTVGAYSLRDAVEKATPEMTDRWTRLYETAHLADADDGPTMPRLLPDDEHDEENP